MRPNILFVMADDHCCQAMSCYGSKTIETPNLDAIAKQGMKFNHMTVTNSLCAPSRAVLLTGKYSHLNGLRSNRDSFDGSQQTFPKLLQRRARIFQQDVDVRERASHTNGGSLSRACPGRQHK
jgi:arylsulfatase A-like enzyme